MPYETCLFVALHRRRARRRPVSPDHQHEYRAGWHRCSAQDGRGGDCRDEAPGRVQGRGLRGGARCAERHPVDLGHPRPALGRRELHDGQRPVRGRVPRPDRDLRQRGRRRRSSRPAASSRTSSRTSWASRLGTAASGHDVTEHRLHSRPECRRRAGWPRRSRVRRVQFHRRQHAHQRERAGVRHRRLDLRADGSRTRAVDRPAWNAGRHSARAFTDRSSASIP